MTAQFEYAFYLDLLATGDAPNCLNAFRHLEEIARFVKVLGTFPRDGLLLPVDSDTAAKKALQPLARTSLECPLRIAVIGFGTFGQFLARRWVRRGHVVHAQSRTDYSDIASTIGVNFVTSVAELADEPIDCIVLSVSILSFEKERAPHARAAHTARTCAAAAPRTCAAAAPRSCAAAASRSCAAPAPRSCAAAAPRSAHSAGFAPPTRVPPPPVCPTGLARAPQVCKSLPAGFLSGKLIVDMLSVKQHAKAVMTQTMPADSDLLCMHPMFGPDSGKNSWHGLPCVYEHARVADFHRAARFLSLFENEGCKMVRMPCEQHDTLAAGSQFVTHLTGRLLSKLHLKQSPIATKGFKALLNLVDNTCSDSFDLFYALYAHNPASSVQLRQFADAFDELRRDLLAYDTAVPNGGSSADDAAAANPAAKISKLVSSLALSKTIAVNNKAIALKNAGKKVIGLNVGEPDGLPCPEAMAAAHAALNDGKVKYTECNGMRALRDEICAYLQREKGLSYQPSQIVCANGGKQALLQAMLALLNPGDEVIVPAPYWVSYTAIAQLCGAKSVTIATRESDSYCLMPQDLEAAITPATRVLIMCNPSNPTGAVHPAALLEKIAAVLRKWPRITIIADEIYEQVCLRSAEDRPRVRGRFAVGCAHESCMRAQPRPHTPAPPLARSPKPHPRSAARPDHVRRAPRRLRHAARHVRADRHHQRLLEGTGDDGLPAGLHGRPGGDRERLQQGAVAEHDLAVPGLADGGHRRAARREAGVAAGAGRRLSAEARLCGLPAAGDARRHPCLHAAGRLLRLPNGPRLLRQEDAERHRDQGRRGRVPLPARGPPARPRPRRGLWRRRVRATLVRHLNGDADRRARSDGGGPEKSQVRRRGGAPSSPCGRPIHRCGGPPERRASRGRAAAWCGGGACTMARSMRFGTDASVPHAIGFPSMRVGGLVCGWGREGRGTSGSALCG